MEDLLIYSPSLFFVLAGIIVFIVLILLGRILYYAVYVLHTVNTNRKVYAAYKRNEVSLKYKRLSKTVLSLWRIIVKYIRHIIANIDNEIFIHE